jgi:N-acetylneuraminate synthase
MELGNKEVGLGAPPFVIAEMSGNHNQSLERALDIVEAAAGTGVAALKIQTYLPETMTLDIHEGEFVISDPNSLWADRSLFELYGEAYTPWEWHEPIFQRCRELGVVPFSTPFDKTSVDFLESIDCPFYKIASFENIDIPLIKDVARTGKPIVISSGMATAAELDEAIRAIRAEGNDSIVLLKCTSSYPASPEFSDIRTIPHMRELFGCEVGLSDHTLGIGVAVAAVALGATVIEKHFTLARADGGVDSAFSLEPSEMSSLVEETERAWAALGSVKYGPSPGDIKSMVFRRSIYVARDIKKGEPFSAENLRVIRPGLGLPPRMFDEILGRTAGTDLKRGTALQLGHLA